MLDALASAQWTDAAMPSLDDIAASASAWRQTCCTARATCPSQGDLERTCKPFCGRYNLLACVADFLSCAGPERIA